MDFNYTELSHKMTALRGAMVFGKDMEDVVGHYSLKSELIASMKILAAEVENMCDEAEKAGPSTFRQGYLNAARAFLKYDLKYPNL